MENPETTLARRFQDIDGPQSRRANLSHLVDSLSPWERRHLRLQLGDRDGLASFEGLPLDLVHLVLPHLFIQDVLACTRVSRKCRASWGNESVVAALSARCFPGLPRPLTFDTFLKTCRRYFLRRAGKYRSMLEVRLPHQSLTPAEPQWMPRGPGQNYPLSDWYRDVGEQFAADPKVHADGRFPAPWPDMSTCGFGCYGGGNVVWLAGPNFVVDNMYTRTRRVVSFIRNRSVLEAPVAPTLSHYANSAASRSLVVFHFAQERRLLIYHLETDTSTHFRLPSNVETMAVFGRRVCLVMSGWQVCVLEHDGAQVLTKFHFKANEGIEKEIPGFNVPRGKNGPQIYVHPHIEDRFFVAMCGGVQAAPPTGVAGTTRGGEKVNRRVRYFAVREYDGAKHIITHLHDVLKLESDEMSRVLADGRRENRRYLSHRLDAATGPRGFQVNAPALDDFGLFEARPFGRRVTEAENMAANGLLAPRRSGETNYAIHMTFNAITREFGLQRYAGSTAMPFGQAFPPWNQQVLVPCVSRTGRVQLQRFDAGDADNPRAGLPGPRELRGGRLEFPELSAQVRGFMEHMPHACWLHHDSDFTVLFVEGLNRYVVWSFVEDCEEEA